MMNFDTEEAVAAKWLESHKDFQLVYADKSESCLQFTCSRLDFSSFFIRCPASVDGNWVRVSIEFYGIYIDVRQYCQDTHGQHINNILDRINEALRSERDGAGDCNEVEDDDTDDEIDDDCDIDNLYYTEEDADVQKVLDRNEEEDDDDECKRFATSGSPVAISRLISDMKALKTSEGKFGIEGCPRGDNLFIWDVCLSDFPADTSLGSDLRAYAKKYSRKPVVELEMTFPNEYPMKPPFVRVVRPRFKFLTGHITIGGSICMEVLTASGWSPSNDIESILIQVRATIMSDSHVQLDRNADQAYTEQEARDAFARMVVKYGWNK